MDETTGKMTSSLAITEKRPHRPGGCVCIFFQLFDWNRRFAKKKLFSRKLLPAAKQVSKKFGGDEKMPKNKLHLNADENSEGFPNGKKNGGCNSVDSEPKHEMRVPGLVARLMGLEFMPAMHKNKLNKPTFSGFCGDREVKFLNEHSGSSREDLKLVEVCAKVEPRPQKIQKTGQFERRAVTRYGAEALQVKGVFSRSRKHHHPKFASPIKSPRVSSARNASRTSRLIDTATKILEPGLLATSRAKSFLTYSSSTLYDAKDLVLTGTEMEVLSPDLPRQSNHNVSICKSFMGQTSCRNCGNMLEVVHSRPNVEEQPFVDSASNFVSVPSPELGNSKLKSPGSSLDKERDVDFRQQPISPYALEKDNNNTQGSVPSLDRKSSLQEGQAQWNFTSQQCKTENEEPSSLTQIQSQMSLCRDRMQPKAKLSNLPSRRVSSYANTISGAKHSVAQNRNFSGCTRPRVPPKVDNSSFGEERKSCNQQDKSLPQLRTPIRKRNISAAGQVEGVGLINSTIGRQRSLRGNMVTGKVKGLNACSMDQTSNKSKADCKRDGIGANGSKDVISLTFNSSLRHKTWNATNKNEKTKNQSDIISEYTYHRTLADEHDGVSPQQKKLPLTGDVLGALLEDKLKELTSQEKDELMTACTPPKRSTTEILQELISAWTAEQPNSLDGHVVDADVPCQTKSKTKGTLVGLAHDDNHLSPGSVLEASFSNDSCVSSSLDNSSAHRLQLDLMDYSQNHLHPVDPDVDLLDSVTSMSKGSAGNQMMIDLINQISTLLHSIDYVDLGLTGSKLSHAKDVILNTELLFGNTSLHKSGGMTNFPIAPFLLDELEVLASSIQPKFNSLLGSEATKDCNQLKGFLFDCWIECFDIKYGRYCNCGFKTWTRLPLRMNTEMLIREVGEEVIRWTHLAGMTPVDIMECEMSPSLGKWTDFDIEAFETGSQVGLDILEIMVEEIVIDLWECWPVSF